MCKHILDSFTPQYAGHRTRLNYISFILFVSLITQHGVWPVTGVIFSTWIISYFSLHLAGASVWFQPLSYTRDDISIPITISCLCLDAYQILKCPGCTKSTRMSLILFSELHC